MCALLSRAYAIPVIGLSLLIDTERLSRQPVGVRIEVELPDGPRLLRDLTLEELGLPLDLPGIDRALTSGVTLQLPAGVHDELRTALEPALTAGEPVWLDFRRPFGHLPAIPWERLLQPHLGVAMLRLPFTAVPAAAGTDPLMVAVCAPWPGAPALRDFLTTVVPALPPHAQVHVFTADMELRKQRPAPAGVIFHEPPADIDVVVETPVLTTDRGEGAEYENPWLRWMAQTIAPDSVDVVHFICAARLSRNLGMLDFGASPTGRESAQELRLVTTAQLLACLTRLGAWSATFAWPDSSSPQHGEAGLRILAHRLTGLMSGPVVVQAPAAGLADDLAGAYRFLFSPTPEPAPTTPTVTLACHPSVVRLASGGAPRPLHEALASRIETAFHECTLDRGILRGELRGSTEPPAWLASSQRLLERWTSAALPTEPEPADTAYDSGVTAALSFISSTIEASVRERGSGA